MTTRLPPLDAFLEAFLKDVKDRAVRPLADYLSRFPGDDAAITREYSAAMDRASSPSSKAKGEPSGNRIGSYSILHEIGRGGQATVYLAEDARLHRKVALKVLDPGLASDRTVFERFRREAEVTSKLDNPGICTVYETGEDGGVLWIAMRYVEGDSLATKIATAKATRAETDAASFVDLAERPVAESSPSSAIDPPSGPTTWVDIMRVVALFEEAARSLHVAHEAGVIHRDMKPGNIMVTKDGKPVILDFGLAREIEGDQPTLTVTGDVMGTPAYMSPEQIAAQRIRLDRRTDVYSLGVSLFECLTLARPFDAPTREGLYHAILTKDPSDARALNPAIPRDLMVVLGTALEKDRDRRYATALHLAEDLRRIRAREPIFAKPVGRLVRLRRWTQRNPALAASLIGTIVILAAGLVVVFVLLKREAAVVADYERLGDLARVQKAVASAEALWPASPEMAPRLAEWVAEADGLASRLPEHRDALSALRQSALPYSDQDRVADAALRAAAEARVKAARVKRDREAVGMATGMEMLDEDAEIAELQARIPDRSTWRFSSDADQFRHDTTARMIAELEAFFRSGVVDDVRSRLEFARTVSQTTIEGQEGRWAAAIRSITQSEDYGGLRIAPQLGLVPIGEDPESLLWEFAHLETVARGADPVPARNPDGRLALTESSGLIFILVPAGTFWMGAVRPDNVQAQRVPNVDPDAEGHEQPVKKISLDAFFLSKYEMTQAQWRRVTRRNPSEYRPGYRLAAKGVDGRHPVEQVGWDDCDKWLKRLGLVLPTEAQWEYAARAGTTTPRWTGSGADSLSGAEHFGNRGGWHVPIGQLAPNPFGLHDVLGNVMEWCRDGFESYSRPTRPGDGLRESNAAEGHAYRGGGWFNDAATLRSAYRFGVTSLRGSNIGVRPARPIDR